MQEIEADAPVTFIGTGSSLDDATANGVERTAAMLGVSFPEVMNRATLAGAIAIGRHPSVVWVTPRVLLKIPDTKGIGSFASGLYTL